MTITVLLAREFVPADSSAVEWLQRLPESRRLALTALESGARDRSLIASHLLWLALQKLGFGPAALASLHYPPRAKPALSLPVDFSLSHGGQFVICAVSTEGPVGADVEAVSAIAADEFVHYLNPAERAWAGNDPVRFCSVWTRKEAVVKAAGGAGLRQLPRVVTQDDGRSALFDGQAWCTRAIEVGAGHVAHLAHAAQRGEVEVLCATLGRDQLESPGERCQSRIGR